MTTSNGPKVKNEKEHTGRQQQQLAMNRCAEGQTSRKTHGVTGMDQRDQNIAQWKNELRCGNHADEAFVGDEAVAVNRSHSKNCHRIRPLNRYSV